MPGSWSYGTEWRVLGICSSLLHLNLILSTFTLLCSPGQETQSFLHSWSAAQMVGGLLGLKEKSGLELCWEVFEPQDYRKTSVQQHGAATVHSSQDAKKIKRGLVVWFGVFFFISRTILFWTYLAHGYNGYYGVTATFSFPAPAVCWRWVVLPSCLLLEPIKARHHLWPDSPE